MKVKDRVTPARKESLFTRTIKMLMYAALVVTQYRSLGTVDSRAMDTFCRKFEEFMLELTNDDMINIINDVDAISKQDIENTNI